MMLQQIRSRAGVASYKDQVELALLAIFDNRKHIKSMVTSGSTYRTSKHVGFQ